MIDSFLSAIALVLVLEGIFPFACPDCFRRTMERVIQIDGKTLRVISLISMLLGVLLLYFVHHYID